ncbi:MAG TPA: hypothetical protein VHJ39_03260 [Solirubrobacteraceae bacterium]|jgi:hypothetical protein|nr:hypothetical protein [Solirubrobacteraceae bacterium]
MSDSALNRSGWITFAGVAALVAGGYILQRSSWGVGLGIGIAVFSAMMTVFMFVFPLWALGRHGRPPRPLSPADAERRVRGVRP